MENKFGKWTISDEELDAQLEAARARAREADETEPRAVTARYDEATQRVGIELSNGCFFAFPARFIKELMHATREQREAVTVSEFGNVLFWDELDAQYGVPGLVAGVFGSKAWMREIGRRGGQQLSEAKSRAARLNGLKGGRPRKQTEIVVAPADTRDPWRTLHVTLQAISKARSCDRTRAWHNMLAIVLESVSGSLSSEDIATLFRRHIDLQWRYAPAGPVEAVSLHSARPRPIVTGSVAKKLVETTAYAQVTELQNAA